MTHERTPLGRELLRLQRDTRTWIALNSSRESANVIETAELLGCVIAEAAWNGLNVTKETLRASATNVETLLRRQSGTARCE
jgi:hypothetical protein